jgi:predicted phosphodiesterase
MDLPEIRPTANFALGVPRARTPGFVWIRKVSHASNAMAGSDDDASGRASRCVAKRVAVLADVHGNAVALAAASEDVVGAEPDLLVFLGDLTWGPLPEETWGLVQTLCDSFAGRTLFVGGNAERALVELRHRKRKPRTERERWMLAAHATSTLDALETFAESVSVEIGGLGRARFCHGSPRSDEELITPATSTARMQELLAGVSERILVTAHTHIQFDRSMPAVRSVNPGSIGLPAVQDALGECGPAQLAARRGRLQRVRGPGRPHREYPARHPLRTQPPRGASQERINSSRQCSA